MEMDTVVLVIIVASALLLALALVWILTASHAKKAYRRELSGKTEEIAAQAAEIVRKNEEIIRREGEARTAEALRTSESEQHEKAQQALREHYE